MSALSRNKGAAFERLVAKELFAELGITFKRKLDQYQERGLSDLTPSDPAFPFLIECKHANRWQSAWWAQASSASRQGLYPALIYRLTGKSIVVRVPVASFCEAAGGRALAGWCETDLATFCALARELMAVRATLTDEGAG